MNRAAAGSEGRPNDPADSPRPAVRLALVCALEDEQRAVGPLPVGARRPEAEGSGVRLVHLDRSEVALLRTGVGARRAQEKVEGMLRSIRVDRVLAFGFAGALRRSLRSGDVVVATEVTSADDPGEVHPADAGLRELAGSLGGAGFRVEAGRLVTASRLLTRAEEKMELGRSSGALVVDMETVGIARALDGAGVPGLYARCVLDEADLDLPPGLTRLIDPQGSLRPTELLRLLASRPASLPALWKLGARRRRAAAHLAWLVRELAGRLAAPGSET